MTLRQGRVDAASALVFGVAAFAYALLSKGRLSNDHYMHLALAQQVLLGDVPGRDFVDPGMPLMYTLSAAVQYLWPGPFSEVVLTTALFGLAASLTFSVVHTLTGHRLAGAAAAAIQVLLYPRLYGYPKILVPAAALWALGRYTSAPTARRLLVLGVVAALSILLRHDLGVFAFLSIVVGLAVNRAGDWTTSTRECARFTGIVVLLLAPFLLLMQFNGGVAEYLREGIEFSRGEAHQLLLPWVRLPSPVSGGLDAHAPIVLYCAAYLLVPLGLLKLVLSARSQQARATAAAAVTLLFCYCLVVLRHPLPARVPDLGAVLAIVGVGVLTAAARRAGRLRESPVRAVAGLVVLLVSAAPLGAVWRLGNPVERVAETRIRDGWGKVLERVHALAKAGGERPWTWYWPTGDMPEVVHYIAQCTAPSDRILVSWFAPEYYFFSQRGFAAGHSFFAPGSAFATARDDRKMVSRIRGAPVPLVLMSDATRDAFAASYPKLHAYIERHYDWFGEFPLRDGTRVRLGLRRGVQARSQFGPQLWPCGVDDRESPGLRRPAR